MSTKREFTGVFIPAHIWTSKEITAVGKMLLAEIDALSQSTGWCYASRAHFAEWLGTTEANLSLHFKKLSDAGFLEIERVPGETNKMRVVAHRFYLKDGVRKTYGGGKENLRGGVRKTYGGGKENLPVNTIERKEEREDESASPSQADETFGLKAEVFKKDNVPPAAPAPPPSFNLRGHIAAMRENHNLEAMFCRDTRLPREVFNTAIDEYYLHAKSISKEGSLQAVSQHFQNWMRTPAVIEKLRPAKAAPRSVYTTPAAPVKFG